MKECHPPIITESEFRAVQEEKKKRSNIIINDDGTHRCSEKYSSKKKEYILSCRGTHNARIQRCIG
jgi:site-specific DNA recombinase